MSTSTASALPQDHPFVLISITAAASPTNSGEKDWHRYIINQGGNEIVGYRRGTPKSVRAEVDALIVQLNDRRTVNKPGRKHITLTPASKKEKANSAA